MPYRQLMRDLRDGDSVLRDGAAVTALGRRGAPMDPARWCGPATPAPRARESRA